MKPKRPVADQKPKTSNAGRPAPDMGEVAKAMLIVEVDGWEKAAVACGKSIDTLKRWKASYASELLDADGAYATAYRKARRDVGAGCDDLLLRVYRKGLRRMDDLLDSAEIEQVADVIKFTGQLRMTHQEIALVDNELYGLPDSAQAKSQATDSPKPSVKTEKEQDAGAPEQNEGTEEDPAELAIRRELARLHPVARVH